MRRAKSTELLRNNTKNPVPFSETGFFGINYLIKRLLGEQRVNTVHYAIAGIGIK